MSDRMSALVMWILGDFWHFCGAVILIVTACQGIAAIIYAIRGVAPAP